MNLIQIFFTALLTIFGNFGQKPSPNQTEFPAANSHETTTNTIDIVDIDRTPKDKFYFK